MFLGSMFISPNVLFILWIVLEAFEVVHCFGNSTNLLKLLRNTFSNCPLLIFKEVLKLSSNMGRKNTSLQTPTITEQNKAQSYN